MAAGGAGIASLAISGAAGFAVLLIASGVAALLSRRGLPEPSPLQAHLARLADAGRTLRRGHDVRRLQARLAAADLSLRPREWYLLRIGTPLMTFALLALRGPLPVALALALPAALLPGAVLRLRAGRRRARLEAQLPDAVRTMLSAVDAGRDVRGALLLCAREPSPQPLRAEFARIQAELQLAVPLEDALAHAAARIGVRDFEVLADGLVLQRQVGGEVGVMLRSTIEALRARAAFRGRLRALTAQSRATKWIVSGLVPAVVLALALLAPSYVAPLLTSAAGYAVLAVAGGLILVAFLVTGRLTDIEV
jgi:tight adherence protein B